MKTKNSKLLVLCATLFATCTTPLVACSSSSTSSSNGITYCTLNKELKAYNDLKVTATVNDTYDRYVNATFKNEGDQYVPLHTYDNEYCNVSNVVVSNSYADYYCPFRNRYIGPSETINVIADCYPYEDQEKCVNTILNKSVRTCYYTSEYTGMEFSDLKIKVVDEEYRKKNNLYNNALLYYKPSGKFKDGDNYHMLINFTYDGEAYTVMSNDPCYEINAFGLDFESPYYINFHQWDDPEGRFKDYVFDENKISVNWVKCYTAWFRNKQPAKCRDSWRCYEDKVARVMTKVAIGVAIAAVCIIPFVVIFLVGRRKRKAGI